LHPALPGGRGEALPGRAREDVGLRGEPALPRRPCGRHALLEAHAPQEELNAADGEEEALRAAQGHRKEGSAPPRLEVRGGDRDAGRGIPVPILDGGSGREGMIASAVEIQRPAQLTGQPRVPPFKAGAWYVRADETIGEVNARRLAAVLNHQGPQIPARVVQKGDRYQSWRPLLEKKSGRRSCPAYPDRPGNRSGDPRARSVEGFGTAGRFAAVISARDNGIQASGIRLQGRKCSNSFRNPDARLLPRRCLPGEELQADLLKNTKDIQTHCGKKTRRDPPRISVAALVRCEPAWQGLEDGDQGSGEQGKPMTKLIRMPKATHFQRPA